MADARRGPPMLDGARRRQLHVPRPPTGWFPTIATWSFACAWPRAEQPLCPIGERAKAPTDRGTGRASCPPVGRARDRRPSSRGRRRGASHVRGFRTRGKVSACEPAPSASTSYPRDEGPPRTTSSGAGATLPPLTPLGDGIHVAPDAIMSSRALKPPSLLLLLAAPLLSAAALGCASGGSGTSARNPAAAAMHLKAPGEATIGDRTTCPVSHEEFVVSASSPKVAYAGKTYYFCCSGCDSDFSKNPAKYMPPGAK